MMANPSGPGPDALETAQAEGEGPDPAESRPKQASQAPLPAAKPPLSSSASTLTPKSAPKLTVQPATPMPSEPASAMSSAPNSAAPTRPPTIRNESNSSSNGYGLPSPDSHSFPKEPGLTHADLAASSPRPPSQRAPSHSGTSALSVGSLSPTSSISEGEWSQPPTPSIPSSVPPTVPPSRANSTSGSVRPNFFRRVSGSKAKDDGASQKGAGSVKSEGDKHKFTLKDLLASGPKLGRRSSQRSVSSQKSDSDGKSVAGESTASLVKKYGVCEKVAIGKGATSVVRLAHKWDRTEEKLYAVKEFRKRRKNETEKDYVKKLTAEFCISSTLHHVNVVETVDLVQDEAQHWCEVMEFCPGGDLYAAIKKGGMSPSEVECCFKQILSGVSYLHGQGVAHRDIKPENLLFDLKGHLKIGDFGASTVYRLPWEKQVHMSTGLCGSEPYIAPEQFLGKPYDARLVDIWACGIVYYCLHFQEIPWRVAQQSDQLYATYASACASTNAEKSNFPPTITNLSPRACRPLIRKMLEPEPKKRWAVEDVMKHAWVDGLEVCYTSAKPGHIHVNATAIAQSHVSVVR